MKKTGMCSVSWVNGFCPKGRMGKNARQPTNRTQLDNRDAKQGWGKVVRQQGEQKTPPDKKGKEQYIALSAKLLKQQFGKNLFAVFNLLIT